MSAGLDCPAFRPDLSRVPDAKLLPAVLCWNVLTRTLVGAFLHASAQLYIHP